ncbi:MAG: anaerobic ribonucleoside-triphosphate reductase activating protein [Lentisphaerae bacterium]|nr:anaerobic ribonucleoside-triphosphate reductase activating protein [Lentisphaerota bacterium]
MKLAGFVPLSLCDYPGHIAAVVFTQGCNFRCPWCHNRHLLAAASSTVAAVDQAEVLQVLHERRQRVNSLVISGGEPTLQEGLEGFVARIKAMRIKVKLDTNGSRPAILQRLLTADLLDFVALDIKAPWQLYGRLIGLPAWDPTPVKESLALLSAFQVPHLLRTTRVPDLLSAAECKQIKQQLPPGSVHVWQEYRACAAL